MASRVAGLVDTNVDTTRQTWAAPRAPVVPAGFDPFMTPQADSPPYPGETPAPYEVARKLRERPGDGTVAKLPPAPRAQNIVEPSQTRQFSIGFQDRYARGDQYIVASPTQNIVGMVEGGPDNANWVRGNDFANEYNYHRIHERPVVQMKDLPKEPKTHANVVPSQFYPYPGFYNRDDMNYKTFPHESSSTYYDFLPFYTYPHRTIDNRDRSPSEKPEMSKAQIAGNSPAPRAAPLTGVTELSYPALSSEGFENLNQGGNGISPSLVSGFLVAMILTGTLLVVWRR